MGVRCGAGWRVRSYWADLALGVFKMLLGVEDCDGLGVWSLVVGCRCAETWWLGVGAEAMVGQGDVAAVCWRGRDGDGSWCDGCTWSCSGAEWHSGKPSNPCCSAEK